MNQLSVLHYSGDILLADKPVGIATEPDRSRAPSLFDLVKAWCQKRGIQEPPHAVSRLDVGVSGVVTFAISPRGRVAAAKAKEAGAIQRRYVAIVGPRREIPERGTIDAKIEGRPALTAYRVLAKSPRQDEGAPKIVLFEPKTGRTHQIRIHAAALGVPIAGDRKYGGASSLAGLRGTMHAVPRTMLHSASVLVRTGFFGDPQDWVVAPVPQAFIELWSALDGAAEAWKDVAAVCVAGSEPPPSGSR